MLRRISSLLLCSTLSFSTYSASDIEQLAQHPTWLKLGHYKSPQELKSYIISDDFFLSPRGKDDPYRELEATINAFNKQPEKQCRYPARYQWLLQQGIKFKQPSSDCDELTQWREGQPIHSVSLVFASGYMSNPASLYGHMLLKLNKATESHNQLLDYSINYGAIVPNNENGLVYISKGLFGGYVAGFSDQLFYRHQHNYGEVELRDLWEYELNLTTDEVRFISNHIWELMGAKYTYYFADENCAFHIAKVIELVAGDKLTNELSPWVIPATIFSKLAVAEHNNQPLVRDIKFTPSRSSTFYQYQQHLNEQENALAKRIFNNAELLKSADFVSLNVQTQKKIIEVLFEFVQLQQLRQYESEHIKVIKKALVRARLKLPIGNEIKVGNHQQSAPHKAQKPSNYSVSALDVGSKTQSNLGFRLSYFDSLASDIARIPYSNLEMLDVEVAVRDSNMYLDKLHILDLESFNPAYTDWINEGGWSWQLNLGFERDRTNCQGCKSTFAMGGVGKSMLLNNDRSLVYGMVNGYLGELASTEQVIDASIEVGVISDIYQDIKIRAAIERFYHKQGVELSKNVEIVVPINQDADFRLIYKSSEQALWQLKLNYYWN